MFLVGIWLILGSTSMISAAPSPQFRTGFTEVAEVLSSASLAALLLTPEQISAIENLWQERQKEVQNIRGGSKQDSPEQRLKIDAEDRDYAQKRMDILTPEQRDIFLSICQVSKSVTKTVYSEFRDQAATASTAEERAKVVAERSKACRTAFQEEMKILLPAERFAAFEAVLAKQ